MLHSQWDNLSHRCEHLQLHMHTRPYLWPHIHQNEATASIGPLLTDRPHRARYVVQAADHNTGHGATRAPPAIACPLTTIPATVQGACAVRGSISDATIPCPVHDFACSKDIPQTADKTLPCTVR